MGERGGRGKRSSKTGGCVCVRERETHRDR